MKKVSMSYADFDKYTELFENMSHKALYYAPTIPELTSLLPNFEKYALFLIWIDETGIETEENAESRRYIKKILRERVVLHD